MKKIIFEATGNIILFILLGMALTKGGRILETENFWLFETNHWTSILVFYLMIYSLLTLFINKKQGADIKHLFFGISLNKDADEREQEISSLASRAVYFTLVLLVSLFLALLLLLKFYETHENMTIDYYQVSVWMLIALAAITNLSFSIRWCIEERK